MVDLDNIIIGMWIAGNATSLIHTVQNMKDNPNYGIVENYMSYFKWLIKGLYIGGKVEIPRHIVIIPLSGPGVIVGTAINKIRDYLRKDSVQYKD